VSRPYAIVFANAKGGVGKTTSAVHVAGAFAEAGVETLVVDLDPQASATRHLGLDPETLSPSLADVLIEPQRGIARAAHETRYPRLWCAPAHPSLGHVESELVHMAGREGLLATALGEEIRQRIVVIDVPPTLGLYTVNALRAADAVVVPVQTHPFALASVPRTLELVDAVRRRLNPRLTVLGFLATLYDRRTRVARECLARMQEEWGDLLLERAIPMNIALAEAGRDGRLLYENAPESPGAAAYLEVAAEILRRWRSAARPAAA
jgi:chromosome partitioning protein